MSKPSGTLVRTYQLSEILDYIETKRPGASHRLRGFKYSSGSFSAEEFNEAAKLVQSVADVSQDPDAIDVAKDMMLIVLVFGIRDDEGNPVRFSF